MSLWIEGTAQWIKHLPSMYEASGVQSLPHIHKKKSHGMDHVQFSGVQHMREAVQKSSGLQIPPTPSSLSAKAPSALPSVSLVLVPEL